MLSGLVSALFGPLLSSFTAAGVRVWELWVFWWGGGARLTSEREHAKGPCGLAGLGAHMFPGAEERPAQWEGSLEK